MRLWVTQLCSLRFASLAGRSLLRATYEPVAACRLMLLTCFCANCLVGIHHKLGVLCSNRAAMSTERPLSAHDCALLDFERVAFTLAGSKEANIRLVLGMSPTKYYRSMSALIDTRGAFGYDPLTTMRLRKSRDERRRNRMEGHRADRGRP